jgi:hypothetical protein
MKIKWWLTSRTTQNSISKHKIFTIFPLILREIDAVKTLFLPAKTKKCPIFSWRCISKFLGYLWRTNDGSHPEPHKTRIRILKITQYFLFSSEKSMLRKRVLSSENTENDLFFMTLEFKILILFMKNKWWLTSRTTQSSTSKYTNFTIFSLILREIDAEKTRFRQRKRKKWPIFHDFDFKILRLFKKNKWWLTSRTTQNTISKDKYFTIFSLILREIDAQKTRFQPAKTPKMTNFLWLWNSKFWGYLLRTNDGSHPETNKTRLQNIKIS